jgi:hypothetical protein
VSLFNLSIFKASEPKFEGNKQQLEKMQLVEQACFIQVFFSAFDGVSKIPS